MTSSSSTVIRPELGSIIRLTIRNEGVLPQPDGPTRTVVRPLGAVRSRPSTAFVPSGKTLLTVSKRITRRSQPHRADPPQGASQESDPPQRSGGGRLSSPHPSHDRFFRSASSTP